MKRSILGFVAAAALAAAAFVSLGDERADAAQPSVTLALPTGMCGGTITGASGTTYTPNAQCQITVSNASDAAALENAGAVVVPAGATPVRIPLLAFRNADGSAMVASSPSSGNFVSAITLGTSHQLSGENAKSNTKTDTALAEIVLPPTYVAGQNLTCTANAQVAGSGTPGTDTVKVDGYVSANAGTEGATLNQTAAQTISSTAADYAFTLTGSALLPGSDLDIKVTSVSQEVSGSNLIYNLVNSVRCQ